MPATIYLESSAVLHWLLGQAEAGDVLMAPAEIPHKFKNLGPGLLETTDIHVSDRWIQTNLDDPDPDD